MNFQEAIELVLATSSKPMTAAEIANVINEKKLYLDWKGKPVNAGLVKGRAEQHTKTFNNEGGYIELIDENSTEQVLINHLENLLFYYGIKNSGIIIPFFLFWGRLTANNSNTDISIFGEYEFSIFFNISNENDKIQYLNDALGHLNTSMPIEITIHDIEWNSTTNEYYISILEMIYYSGIVDHKFSNNRFISFFNKVVQYFGYENRKEGNTNRLLSNIVQKIVGSDRFENVFDPFAGSGGLVCNLNINKDVQVHLQDFDKKSVYLSFMNLIINGFNNFSIKHTNSLLELPTENYDLIVTEPPYGVKLNGFNKNLDYLFLEKSYKIESISLQMILDCLSPDGKAVVPVPEGFLTSRANIRLRKYLLDNDLILMVISLPSNVYWPVASIKTTLIVIDKNKSINKRGVILFQELNEQEIKDPHIYNFQQSWENVTDRISIISTAELRSNPEFSLDRKHYVQYPEFNEDNYLPIKKLITSIRLGSNKKASYAVDKKYAVEYDSVPLIFIKDLSNSSAEYVLDASKAEKKILFNEKEATKNIIQQESILVAKVGSKLKPTYYDGNSPISISSNVIALCIKSDQIIPEYFISQLNQEYVIQQLKNIRKGTAQSHFNIKDFLKISIKIDTIENQEKALNDYFKRELKETTFLIKDEIRKSEELETTILSALQHELRAQILQPLVEEVGVMRSYLNRKQEETPESFSWDERVSTMLRSRKVEEVFLHFDKIIGTANKLFDNIQNIIKLDKNKLNKKKLNLQGFIKSCLEEFGEALSTYHIVYNFDYKGKSNIQCEIDPDSFKNVISNFVRNSIEHGFSDLHDIRCIVFNVSKHEITNEIILDMLDNGKGFSNDFNFTDYISFGVRSKSSGSGIGGYLLDRTIKIHDGRVEYISRNIGLISIPSVRNYPFNEKVKLFLL
jgi:type I restriction enzyme M protein